MVRKPVFRITFTADEPSSRFSITVGTDAITSASPLSSSSTRAESSGTTRVSSASSFGFSPQ